MTFDLELLTIVGLLAVVSGFLCVLWANNRGVNMAQKRSIEIENVLINARQAGDVVTVSRYNDTVSIAIGVLEATMSMEQWEEIVKHVKEL